MLKRLALVGVAVVAWAATSVTHVAAKTPDGATPAEETVCDVLTGATPGLYGLCVAFCEAQDNDLVDPTLSTSNARRLLENYNKKKGAGDPDMPCLPECPCWNAASISVVNADDWDCYSDPAWTATDREGGLFTLGITSPFCAAAPPFFLERDLTEKQYLACYGSLSSQCSAIGDPL